MWPDSGFGQSDVEHAIGLALDLDLQMAIGGAKGELDVACDHRPVAVAAELAEPRLARHAVLIGVQLDRDVLRSRRQGYACGKANFELENRIGGIRVEPGRRGGERIPVICRAGSGAQHYDDAERLETVGGQPAGLLRATPSHAEPGAKHQARDRAGRCEHQQRQYAGLNWIGRISESGEFERQQRGEEARHRADHAADDVE